MKRNFLPVALILCAAACAPVPTNTNTANTNAANANAANSNTASTAAAWTDEDVIANERAAWDAIKRKDSAAFAAMLADEFIDVTPVGIKNKAQTVDYVKTFDLTEASLSDFKTIKLGKTAAAVTYTVRLKGSVGGKPIPEAESAARASTAKVWRGGKWHAVYHQTSGVEAAAPPSLVPSPAATAAMSPAAAASPAATAQAATDNVLANEDAVWDALKRKDWDAFAGFLAEDQIEVESTGVYDKAGTLSAVKQIDFSTTRINEQRAMGIGAGDEAKIVTYTITGVGPDRKPFAERAATIWALRDGRWRAVFHQGTAIADAGP